MPQTRRFVIPFPRATFLVGLLAGLLVLSSCVGINADISVAQNGSGTVALEYRISRLVEAMGKVDGNERWLPLPVGRPDLERTVSRVNGLSLRSFSSSRDENDVTVKAELAFANLDALKGFLDGTGRSVAVEAAAGKRALALTLSEGGGPLDPDLEKLVRNLFASYRFELRFNAPTALSASFAGKALPGTAAPVGTATLNGRTLSYGADIADLLSSKQQLQLRLEWSE